MNDVADIRAVIYAEDRASGTLKAFGDNVAGTSNGIASVARVAAEALAVAGAAAVGFAAVSLKAYAQSEAIGAQLNQVLLTTGKNSTISSGSVDQLAKSMEQYSGKTKDSIIAGQTLLLQFSEVTKKNLPEMTKAMLDLSQRMGIDTVAAAKTLGISLDNPTLGMTRLKKAGIDFTVAQVDQVKAMQKAGDLAGAQAILMQGLQDKIGGAAGAYRNTLSGAIESARSSLKDFEITVGGTIATSLEPLAKKAALALASIDWQQVVNNTISVLKDWGRELDILWVQVDKIYQEIEKYLWPKIKDLDKAIQNIYPTIKTFIDNYIIPMAKAFGTVAGEGLVGAIGLLIDTATFLIDHVMKPLMDFMNNNKVVVYTFAGAFIALRAAMMLQDAFAAVQIGFITLTNITIPSAIASIEAFKVAMLGIGAPAIIAGAVVIGIFAKIAQTALGAMDAVDNLTTSVENAGIAEDQGIRKIDASNLTPTQKANEIRTLYGKASGGPVAAGTPYIVGEQGQELFIPGQSGTIINNSDTKQMLGGNTSININVNAQAFMGSQIQARQFAQTIFKALQDLAASKNTTVAALVAKTA